MLAVTFLPRFTFPAVGVCCCVCLLASIEAWLIQLSLATGPTSTLLRTPNSDFSILTGFADKFSSSLSLPLVQTSFEDNLFSILNGEGDMEPLHTDMVLLLDSGCCSVMFRSSFSVFLMVSETTSGWQKTSPFLPFTLWFFSDLQSNLQFWSDHKLETSF